MRTTTTDSIPSRTHQHDAPTWAVASSHERKSLHAPGSLRSDPSLECELLGYGPVELTLGNYSGVDAWSKADSVHPQQPTALSIARASTCFIVSNTSSTVSSTSEATATRSFAMSDFQILAILAVVACAHVSWPPPTGAASPLLGNALVRRHLRLQTFRIHVECLLIPSHRRQEVCVCSRCCGREPITLRLHAFHWA